VLIRASSDSGSDAARRRRAAKLAELDLAEETIRDTVAWARNEAHCNDP